MVAYSMTYKIRGKEQTHEILIEAKDAKSAKRKIGKKHGYKDGRMVHIIKSSVIGYL